MDELQTRISQMNLNQVQERMTQIQRELEQDNADVEALGQEVDLLIARKTELETQARNVKDQEKRQSLLARIAQGVEPTTTVDNPTANEGAAQDTGRSSMQYRQAFMNYCLTGVRSDILETEQRAAEVGVASDLGVLLPETIIQKVMTELDGVYGQLYSRVRKTNIRGGVKYPIGSFKATFKRITETTVSERQKAGGITGYVEFSYNIGEIRIARTLLQSILTVEAFESEVAKSIVKAYVKACDYEILFGDPSKNEFEGILTEAKKESGSRIKAENIIEMTAEDVADWTQWEKLLFAQIPMAMENSRPEFVMAKQTYVGNLCTLKDANGQPIKKAGFDVSDKQHKFNEYPVNRVEKDMFQSFDACNAGDIFGMFWVPEEAYAINSNLQFNLVHYFDHETNQYVDKAIVVNDGKILNPDFLYLLKKK